MVNTKQLNSSVVLSLEAVLGSDHESLEQPELVVGETAPIGWDEETAGNLVAEGYCVECEDQPAQVSCETCVDVYCEVCFSVPIPTGSAKHIDTDVDMKDELDACEELDHLVADASGEASGVHPAIATKVGELFVERAKYIPLRLTIIERKYLRLLEAALSVSEYTDKIDIISFGTSKAKRIVHQIRELCAIMSGLLLSADYKQGQELFRDRDFQANADFYQRIFELGRRHKIMNPDKMRTTYGKLIYLLQVGPYSVHATILGSSLFRIVKDSK